MSATVISSFRAGQPLHATRLAFDKSGCCGQVVHKWYKWAVGVLLCAVDRGGIAEGLGFQAHEEVFGSRHFHADDLPRNVRVGGRNPW